MPLAEPTKEFKFVKAGKLNMVIIRNGKNVEPVPINVAAFLANEVIIKTNTMDVITFQPNVVFKFTLDFKSPLPCIEGTNAVRESTDWILCSSMGTTAHFNKVDETLILQQCVVSIQTNVAQFAAPFNAALRLNDEEWEVVKVWR